MATVKRHTYTTALPVTAEIFTRGGVKYAKWKGKRGRTVTGTLSEDGTRVSVETPKWYVEFMDENGKQKHKAGYTDRRATETLAEEIQQRIDRIRAGTYSADMDHAKKPLAEHIDDFERFMRSKGGTDRHVKESVSQIRRVMTAAKCHRISQITLDNVSRAISGMTVIPPKKKPLPPSDDAKELPPVVPPPPPPLSLERRNHYVRAVRSFTRWLLIDQRTTIDPLAGLSLYNANTDQRRVRRVLSAEEFGKLIQHTRESETIRQRMTGPDRAILYTLAAYTGFRAAELRSLTVESFDLNSDPPCVVLKAGDAKNRKDVRQPVHDDLVSVLAEWLQAKYSGEVKPDSEGVSGVFAFWRHIKLGKMLREDAESAGLVYSTESGTFDFHALRSQFITGLIRAGVPLDRAQRLARHQSPTTTAKHYVRFGKSDLSDAVNALPPPPTFEKTEPK